MQKSKYLIPFYISISLVVGIVLGINFSAKTPKRNFIYKPEDQASGILNQTLRFVDAQYITPVSNMDQFASSTFLKGLDPFSKLKKIDRNEKEVNLETYDLKNGNWVIKVPSFGKGAYRAFMNEIETLEGKGKVNSLWLDLSGNKGGYLHETVNMLNQLYKEKAVTLFFRENRNQKLNTIATTGKSFFDFGDIFVIVDGNTASSAEIFASAVQDTKRGKIIGERTYGKGLIQQSFALNDTLELGLTVGRFYAASGRSIQKNEFYREISAGEVAIDSSKQNENYGVTPDFILTDEFKAMSGIDFYNKLFMHLKK